MTGIEFYDAGHGPLFTKAAYESGMFALYANNDQRICQLRPPLIITKEQVDEIITKTDKALGKLKLYSLAVNTKASIKNIFGK